MSQRVGALHIAPAFSCLEIVDVVYHDLIKKDKKTGKNIDLFLMSKGHGCVSQYVVLQDLGVLKESDIRDYCTPQGVLGAHPDRGVPGIEASTGSLGHGLGLAVGMAYAEKLKKSPARIFCLVSDGELQEGSSWEAVMMAANLALSNLTVFVDLNDFGGMHRMSEYHKAFYPIDKKFESFGWHVSVVDGHCSSAILAAAAKRPPSKPAVIICETTKGKGVSYMENVPIWHYRSPNEEEFKKALVELEGGKVEE